MRRAALGLSSITLRNFLWFTVGQDGERLALSWISRIGSAVVVGSQSHIIWESRLILLLSTMGVIISSFFCWISFSYEEPESPVPSTFPSLYPSFSFLSLFRCSQPLLVIFRTSHSGIIRVPFSADYTGPRLLPPSSTEKRDIHGERSPGKFTGNFWVCVQLCSSWINLVVLNGLWCLNSLTKSTVSYQNFVMTDSFQTHFPFFFFSTQAILTYS